MSDVHQPESPGEHPDPRQDGPQRRDYQLDDVLDIDTADRIKALGDPLRLQICDLVLERAYSVTELAERVDRPKGTVAYHVDLLVDAGLLKVVRTRRVRAVDERFYGRVARTYLLHDTIGPEEPLGFLGDVLREVDRERMGEQHDPNDESAPTWTRATMTTYRRARIPADRAAEYARRLSELTLEFVDEPRDGDVEFGLYVALFPTNRLRSTARATEPADESSTTP